MRPRNWEQRSWYTKGCERADAGREQYYRRREHEIVIGTSYIEELFGFGNGSLYGQGDKGVCSRRTIEDADSGRIRTSAESTRYDG